MGENFPAAFAHAFSVDGHHDALRTKARGGLTDKLGVKHGGGVDRHFVGAGEILLTSMDQDGVKSGYDLGVTRAISDAIHIPVIASGGVGNLQHLADGVLQGRADAVLAASIFHFGEYTIPEAKAFMAAQGIVMR